MLLVVIIFKLNYLNARKQNIYINIFLCSQGVNSYHVLGSEYGQVFI